MGLESGPWRLSLVRHGTLNAPETGSILPVRRDLAWCTGTGVMGTRVLASRQQDDPPVKQTP
ncbi:hypothetical protein BM1_10484 [Bipolaris maydis]|nr:hypothetical protein BM1_10484 [Bipolaris maydis]